MQLRDRNGQYSADTAGELRQSFDVTAHVIGMEHLLFAALAQPVHQGIDLRRRRCVSDQVAALGADDGCATGSGEGQQHFGLVEQAFAHAVTIGHRRQHAYDALTQLEQGTGAVVGFA